MTSMTSSLGRLVGFVVACLAFAGSAAAQEGINRGTIAGRVLDPQGAAVPGAVVTARQTDTNVTAEAASDPEGRFRFPYLRIGPYEVTATLQGFRTSTRT